MAEQLARSLADAMAALPKELIIFLVSMLPLIELRGGLILAPILDIPMFKAIPICLAGNILPIPFILWFITPIFSWLKTTKLFRPLVEKLEAKFAGEGRVLIRPSGTEPLVRVMIEGKDQAEIEADAKALADLITKTML